MSRIFRKLFISYIFILFICLIILGPIIAISLRDYYNARLSHELWLSSVLARYILMEDIIDNNSINIQNKSKDIGKELGLRVTIISKDGTVLGDSAEDPKQMENHRNRPEVKNALAGKTGRVLRYSSTLKQDLMYVAVPVMENSNVLGAVRFAISQVDAKANIVHIYKTVIYGSLLGALFALLLSVFTANSFTKPIRLIQKTAQKITMGDLKQRNSIKINNELGDLADSLNQMADELERKIYEVTKDKQELEAILGSMAEGVMVIGKDEKIVLVNSPITKTFDLRTKDAVGKPYWEVIRNEEINSILRETIRNKQSMRKEVHIFSPEDIYFNVQTSVIMNPVISNGVHNSSEVLGALAVFHNITELIKIDKMRKEFTANVSHELKTPLTSIKGFVETLLDGAVDDKQKSKEYLNIIKTHTDRLEYLLNDLLSLARIESREIKMEMSNVRIQNMINKVTALYKNKLHEKQLILANDIPEDIPSIYVDEAKMEQVFSNLLDNAIKFTPNNGKINIKAGEEKDFIKIDFKDTGIGIPKEHIPRIFERFYTVDKARSRELGGTGLGLSIVKHIIEAHGGKITVESAMGTGSIFSVYLPHLPI